MMHIDEIKLIEKEMRKIIPIFLKELIEYVPFEKRRFLKDEMNLPFIISFENGFGAWCRGNNIFFSIQNTTFFKKLSKREDFGKNPNTELVSEQEFIENDKDYLDYMQYIVDNGLTELDYSLDVLAHEVMHLVGCGGGVLGEGVTELRTRQICKKYGIRCAPIMHSKETKLVRMLEKHIGEMRLNEAAFTDYYELVLEKCEKVFGTEFKDLYQDLCIAYREYLIDRSFDPIEHYKKYREINFQPIYDLIESKNVDE